MSEYEFTFIFMRTRLLLMGLLLWVCGTIGVRLGGQFLLKTDHPLQTLTLYLVSFVLMAFWIPRICRQPEMTKESWFAAVALLVLPTLILDPFSSAFFSTVFPNVDPGASGEFGGWILICCGGAITGVLVRG